jgi:hypothetical protein
MATVVASKRALEYGIVKEPLPIPYNPFGYANTFRHGYNDSDTHCTVVVGTPVGLYMITTCSFDGNIVQHI